VTERLVAEIERLGVGNLLGLFQLGTLPGPETRASMTLFSEQIMPVLRDRFPGTERRPETMPAKTMPAKTMPASAGGVSA
jgi:hypothetical protein